MPPKKKKKSQFEQTAQQKVATTFTPPLKGQPFNPTMVPRPEGQQPVVSGPTQVWQEGTPATPRVDPFFTARDLEEFAQRSSDLAAGLQDLDYELGRLKIKTDWDRGQLDELFGDQTRAATDDAIRRGLYTSSIKDEELVDIDRTITARKGLLDTEFNTATIRTADLKKRLTDTFDEWQKAYNRRAVENAEAVNAGGDPGAPGQWVPAPKTDTTPGVKGQPFDATREPRPPATTKKAQKGVNQGQVVDLTKPPLKGQPLNAQQTQTAKGYVIQQPKRSRKKYTSGYTP